MGGVGDGLQERRTAVCRVECVLGDGRPSRASKLTGPSRRLDAVGSRVARTSPLAFACPSMEKEFGGWWFPSMFVARLTEGQDSGNYCRLHCMGKQAQAHAKHTQRRTSPRLLGRSVPLAKACACQRSSRSTLGVARSPRRCYGAGAVTSGGGSRRAWREKHGGSTMLGICVILRDGRGC